MPDNSSAENSSLLSHKHLFKAKLASMTNLANRTLDDEVCSRSSDLMLCNREHTRGTHRVIELQLHQTFLDEVDIFAIVSKVVDKLARHKGLPLEVLARIQNFHQGPIAQYWYLL